MEHPVVLALFDDSSRAATAARGLRNLGVIRERVSIVARSHDEEGRVAKVSGASPGSEIEDSAPASQLGELGAHLLAAIALVMPGIGHERWNARDFRTPTRRAGKRPSSAARAWSARM